MMTIGEAVAATLVIAAIMTMVIDQNMVVRIVHLVHRLAAHKVVDHQ